MIMQTKQSFTCERVHVRGKKTKINTHTESHTLTNRHSHMQHGWLSAHCSGVHCPVVTSRCLCLSLFSVSKQLTGVWCLSTSALPFFLLPASFPYVVQNFM